MSMERIKVRDILDRLNYVTSPAKSIKIGFTSDPDGAAEIDPETEIFLCVSGIYCGGCDLDFIFSKKLLDCDVSGFSIISEDMMVIHVYEDFR